MVNVYFCVINEVTKPILNELRHVRSKNVKLWSKVSQVNKYQLACL